MKKDKGVYKCSGQNAFDSKVLYANIIIENEEEEIINNYLVLLITGVISSIIISIMCAIIFIIRSHSKQVIEILFTLLLILKMINLMIILCRKYKNK